MELLCSRRKIFLHIIEIDNVSDQTVNNDFVMLVKIVDLLEFNLIMGITYIPPEISNYSSVELF